MSTWKETYVNLAVAFDATISDIVEDYTHLKEARTAMIDLTSIDDGSQPGYGTEASVSMLCQMEILVRQSKLHVFYDTYRINMVKAINDFTIFYYGDLDDFVNSLDWPDLCAPVFWASLTEDTGTDTSNWIVCS